MYDPQLMPNRHLINERVIYSFYVDFCFIYNKTHSGICSAPTLPPRIKGCLKHAPATQYSYRLKTSIDVQCNKLTYFCARI